MKLKINNVRISLLHEQSLEQAVCKKAGISREMLGGVQILRKAVDARKKQDVCLNYHVLADIEANGRQAKRLLGDRDISKYEQKAAPELVLGTLPLSAPPVVIGAGPAGLLAALQLAEHGYQPLLLERGKPVAERVQDVQRFWSTGDFNPASNVRASMIRRWQIFCSCLWRLERLRIFFMSISRTSARISCGRWLLGSADVSLSWAAACATMRA